MKKVLFIVIISSLAFIIRVQAQAASASSNQDELYTTNIDTAPEYKDGMDNFYQHLQHIPYTFYDRMSNHQGQVTVVMIIEKDGSLTNLKILHGISEKQDKEIMRVIRHLNKWKPGMLNGKPVRVLCSIPISFQIAKASRSAVNLIVSLFLLSLSASAK
jgi:hypothetical protein